MTYRRLEDGDWELLDDAGKVVLSTEVVAIAYSDDGVDRTVLRHGPPDVVTAWVARAKSQMLALGPDEREGIGDIRTIETADWDADDLNGILWTQGALGRFLRKEGL